MPFHEPDLSGQMTAIAYSGPLSAIRLGEREAGLARMEIEHADTISQRLGYVTPPLGAARGVPSMAAD